MDCNMKDLLDVAIRAMISLVTLFLITKMLGKKQVSQLSLFDYVIGISIGNFAAEMTINLDSHYLHGTLAVIIFGVVAYLISILTMKSIVLRRYFMGVPTIVIEDGKIILSGLKKVHYEINDLLEECRIAGYFDISEIAYAIVEASGDVSILPKSEYKAVTLKDMKIKGSKANILANIIIDGKIMVNNLKSMKKDEKWLLNYLDKKNIDLDSIILATLDNGGKVNIFKKEKIKNGGILE